MPLLAVRAVKALVLSPRSDALRWLQDERMAFSLSFGSSISMVTLHFDD